MKKLRKIKRQIILGKKSWRYFRSFENRQMRFLISKIALIYNPEISINFLVELEKRMQKATTKLEEKMFEKIFIDLGEKIKEKARWDKFGLLIYYIYQTSTYYKDKIFRRKNVYNGAIVEKNSIKRRNYHIWLNSLDHSKKDFNKKLIRVQRIIF